MLVPGRRNPSRILYRLYMDAIYHISVSVGGIPSRTLSCGSVGGSGEQMSQSNRLRQHLEGQEESLS